MERATKDRLKVHRRSLRLAGLDYTILSPRPSETSRFATNFSHETWHVISDRSGAQLLARLCWAMAFQRRERTIVLLDSDLLVPNPFDADPSSAIVIVNNDLGPFGHDVLKDLRSKLPLRAASDGTVVLQTRGLDVALEDTRAFHDRDDQAGWRDGHQKRRWIDGSQGIWVLAAPPPVLRVWGVELSDLGDWSSKGTGWAELDYPAKTGEVQVLDEFERRVSSAVATRAQLFPGTEKQRLPEPERSQIWAAIQVAAAGTAEGGKSDRDG
jgi:hypothetical protein